MSASDPLTEEQYAHWWNARGLAELRQVLYWRWDPLGIEWAFPYTEGEYDRYARVLLSRLRQGATARDVARYLGEVERDAMELPSQDEVQLLTIGQRVVDWYGESIRHWIDLAGPDAVRQAGSARS